MNTNSRIGWHIIYLVPFIRILETINYIINIKWCKTNKVNDLDLQRCYYKQVEKDRK